MTNGIPSKESQQWPGLLLKSFAGRLIFLHEATEDSEVMAMLANPAAGGGEGRLSPSWRWSQMPFAFFQRKRYFQQIIISTPTTANRTGKTPSLPGEGFYFVLWRISKNFTNHYHYRLRLRLHLHLHQEHCQRHCRRSIGNCCCGRCCCYWCWRWFPLVFPSNWRFSSVQLTWPASRLSSSAI